MSDFAAILVLAAWQLLFGIYLGVRIERIRRSRAWERAIRDGATWQLDTTAAAEALRSPCRTTRTRTATGEHRSMNARDDYPLEFPEDFAHYGAAMDEIDRLRETRTSVWVFTCDPYSADVDPFIVGVYATAEAAKAARAASDLLDAIEGDGVEYHITEHEVEA